jgi:hypothetical protein
MKKICTKCGVARPLTEFRTRAKNSNKLRSHCNKCLSEAALIYNKANSEQCVLNTKKLRERSKEDASLRYAGFKSRMGEKVQLSFEEYCYIFRNDPPCIYCGSLIRATGSGLDRIDNTLGYTVSNVNPCCGTCNDIRGYNLTVEEMKVAMTAVVKFRKHLT